MPGYRALCTAALVLLLAGCAGDAYLLVGELETPDSQGVERLTQVYWIRSGGAGQALRAGPLTLRTACAPPIVFEQASDGIVFRGDPQRDRLVELASESGPAVRCGRVETRHRLVDLGPGELPISFYCEPVGNEYTVTQRNYPRASSEPYRFRVRAQALTGTAGPPPAPACTD